MINGAVEIIRGVPASLLDPLKLPESFGADMTGYIVVSLQDRAGSFHLLFLRGRQITGCATVEGDLRTIQTMDTMRTLLGERRDRLTVSLYRAPAESVERFIATFHYEPCLKIRLDGLSRRQRSALLESSSCTRGILELDYLSDPLPKVELHEFVSRDELLGFASRLGSGWLLLYDIERNRELLSRRAVPRLISRDLPPPQVLIRRIQNTQASETVSGSPRSPANDFTSLIQNILDAPAPKPDGAGSKPVPASQPHAKAHLSSGRERAKKTPQKEQVLSTPPQSPPVTADEAAAQVPQEPVPETEISKLFDHLLRAFRQHAFKALGARLEPVIDDATKEVQFVNPDFNPADLTFDTAPLVLDLIEMVVQGSPILRRARVKAAALRLVTDLHSNHFEALDRRGVLSRVEQAYYRLKG